MATSTSTVLGLVPCFAYEDALQAIEFLCTAFGFEKSVVYEGAPGVVEHAQLKLGEQVIMVGSTGRNAQWPSRSPRELGGATGGVYVVFAGDADVDAHYARAKAAGAEMLIEPYSPAHGGRSYSAKDCEGNLWSFGSYRPETTP